MSTWDYRVTATRTEGNDVYEIREVHYHEDGTVAGWVGEPSAPYGETLEWLRDDVALIGSALTRPVLDISDEANPVEVTA